MSEDLTTITINDVLYVYMTEETIERISNLIGFARDNEARFHDWRRRWGEEKFASARQQ